MFIHLILGEKWEIKMEKHKDGYEQPYSINKKKVLKRAAIKAHLPLFNSGLASGHCKSTNNFQSNKLSHKK